MKKDEYKDIVISLHQNWWEEMKAGRKLLEIRKTRPQGKGPYTVMVYVTGGVGIVGEFVCDCFYRIDTEEIPLWALPEDEAGTQSGKGKLSDKKAVAAVRREHGKAVVGLAHNKAGGI